MMPTVSSGPQFDLFLSHNSRDKEIVELIAERLLEELGIVSWIDVWAIPAAADWRAEIDRGLAGCRGCAVFIGESGWGEFHLAEARRALEHRLERPEFVVIPILLPGAREEDLAVLPELFGQRQRVDFTNPAAEDEAIVRIAAALRGEQAFPVGRPRMSPYTIRRDANRWAATGGRDRSILYRGRTLAAAKQLVVTYSGQLDAAAFRFLSAASDAERRRLRATIGGAVVVLLALGVLLTLAEVNRRSARRRLAALYVEQGRDALLRRDPAAPLYLHAALELGGHDPDLPFLLSRALSPLTGQTASLHGHSEAVNQTDFSADGRHAATAGADHVAIVWALPRGEPTCALRGHRASVRTVQFSPDGARLLTASNDASARIWDVRSCRSLAQLAGHTEVVEEAAWNADARLVVTAGYDGTARVWNAQGAPLATLRAGDDVVVRRAMFAGDAVLTGDSEGIVRVWDWRAQRVTAMIAAADLGLEPSQRTVNDVAVSRDGRVAAAFNTSVAVLWTPATNERMVLRGSDDGSSFETVAFAPDGSRLVAGDTNGVTRIWNVTTGAALQELHGHHGFTESAVFDPSGRTILTAGSDGTAKLWRAVDGMLLAVLDGLQGKLRHAAFDRGGTRVSTSGIDGRAIVWEWSVARGSEVWRRHESSDVNEARFASRAPRLVTTGDDGSVVVYDSRNGHVVSRFAADDAVRSADISADGSTIALAYRKVGELRGTSSGALLHRLAGHQDNVTRVRFHPDGNTVVTASDDGKARVWDGRSGAVLHELPHRDHVTAVTYDAAGKRLLTASLDFTAAIWDAARPVRLHVLGGHLTGVGKAALSADGSIAVTSELTAKLYVWNAATGRRAAELIGHSGYINDCAINHDATLVASAGSDGTARVWDASTGRALQILGGHDGRVVAVRFSPEGRLLATVSESPEVRIWSVGTGRLLARLPHGQSFAAVAEFAPDGNALLTSDGEGVVRLWPLGQNRRSEREIAALLAALVPYRLREGRAEPVRRRPSP